MPAAVSARSYRTHFYCALCGGPFAKVKRTAVAPTCVIPQGHEAENDNDGSDDAEDTDPSVEFNLPPEENTVLPEACVTANMSPAAKRSKALRLRAEREGFRRGMMPEERVTWQAYDGNLISTKQMKWTKCLRALVSRDARHHPQNYQDYLPAGGASYLTGRGIIRQSENWADAYASIEEDEAEGADVVEGADGDDDAPMVHSVFPVFSERNIRLGTYGFQVYQELGRMDSYYVISSIPFHDECWTLLDLAIEVAGDERGIERVNEKIGVDDLWNYLRGFVGLAGVADSAMMTDSTYAALLEGQRGAGIVTRLGEVDYREGQGAGEGWQWKHEEGLHWLVADPSSISVLDSPLLPLTSDKPLPYAPRAALLDPFQSLPPEILLGVCSTLTSTDIFALKTASPAVHNLGLPDSFYRRFLRDEFRYLPTLVKELTHRQLHQPEGVDWRGSFERLRRLMTAPGPGESWQSVDIGLKNRNRIWKIVKPMADHFVESSSFLMQERDHAPMVSSERTGVVRGYAGVRSGREGVIESAYFGPRVGPIEEDIERLEESVSLPTVRVWMDSEGGPLCGLGFCLVFLETGGEEMPLFGRKGAFAVDVDSRGMALTGFVFCFANHIVCGVQLVFNDSVFSRRIGQWNGVARKFNAPSRFRKLVGVIGFVNSGGFIETVGVLEETIPVGDGDDFGPLFRPPRAAKLTHREASVWKKIPPAGVLVLERQGPYITDWKICMAEWEVWEGSFGEEGVEAPPQGRRTLLEIVGYYDHVALRGLEFVYRDQGSGERVTSVLGTSEGAKRDSIIFGAGDSVAAVVICYGDTCAHGILFVSAHGRVSEVFGPRYLGTHKVFVPNANIGALQTVSRTETMGDIIGLHYIYDYEDKVFLQLGLMLKDDQEDISEPLLPCPVPFHDISDRQQAWENGAPPDQWQIASRPGEVGQFTHNDDLGKFAGWVALDSLCEITIYGRMNGIRFSFANPRERERFFGYAEDESKGVFVQKVDYFGGERVTGVMVIRDDVACSSKEQLEGISDTGDEDYFLDRIHFLTNRDEGELRPCKYRVASPYLVAIKFDFNYRQLISWKPIYKPNPSVPESLKIVSELIQYPWKCHSDDVYSDQAIKPTSCVECTFFEEAGKPVDAVKGYVSKSGLFCGLLFRRAGSWERGVFGQRSAYESTFELQEGERFTSMFLTKNVTFSALALCTSLGRTTPWFGTRMNETLLRKPRHGEEAVGIYGTLEKRIDWSDETIEWDEIGLLCRRPSIPCPAIPDPDPPLLIGIQGLQPLRAELEPRYTDSLPNGFWLSPLAMNIDPAVAEHERIGRSICLFDPAHLQQIMVHINVRGSGGIKSIRFRGGPKMGLVTLGEWPDREYITIQRGQKFGIAGALDERITKIDAVYQRLGNSSRVLELVFTTSEGRRKRIVSSELLPGYVSCARVLDCGEEEEIVGVHGVIRESPRENESYIADVGLVLRRRSRPPVAF